MVMIIHIIMNTMKNRWLLVNGQINSAWESCLKYSNKNLIKLYRNKKIIEIFHIFRFFCLICFKKIIIKQMNNKNHSNIIDSKFVLTLSDESILS